MADGGKWVTKQTVVGFIVAVLASVIAGILLLPGGVLSRPDIDVSDPRVQETIPDNVIEPHEQMRVVVRVVNDGNSAAVDCTTTFYDSSGSRLFTTSHFSVEAGDNREAWEAGSAPGSIGKHAVKAVVSCPTKFLFFTRTQTDSETVKFTVQSPQ